VIGPAADQVLRLADGRVLGFRVYGDPDGAPLLFLHGTPGSRLMFAVADHAARALGLALVAPDRWGYGLSDAAATRSLSAFAADMTVLMDHLHYGPFAVGGISGGGPYAAGIAAHLGPRVTTLALVSPMGPVADPMCRPTLSWFQRLCFEAAPRSPLALATVFRIFRLALERSPRLAAELATLRAGPRDKALIADPVIAGSLLDCFREGLRPGMAGAVGDVQLFARAWDADLANVAARARLWISTADTAVPISAARLLARAIPDCTLTELQDEGHFWVAANYAQVLEWIAETVSARTATSTQSR
jgi:pimeloyl-ACP methyl ester carboxylesterase